MKSRAVVISLCTAVMTVGGLAAGAAPASASVVNSPGWQHIMNEGSGGCLDVMNTGVQQWRCLNTQNEEWRLVTSAGQVEIENHASGLCLGQADSVENGTPVVQVACLDDPKQEWARDELGTDNNRETVQFVNSWSGQCIDLENGETSNGVPMQVWDCNASTNNQRWQPL
jgi:hypothetical protein